MSTLFQRHILGLSYFCSFENSHLRRRLDQGLRTCPITGCDLRMPIDIEPNVSLREDMKGWVIRHARWPLVSSVVKDQLADKIIIMTCRGNCSTTMASRNMLHIFSWFCVRRLACMIRSTL